MTRPPILTIDMHAHVGLPQVAALLGDQPGMAEQRSIEATALGPTSLAYNITLLAELRPRLVDLDLVLERHPALRIWSAHGGGYLGSCIVRAEHAWHAREDARTTHAPPSELLRRTYVDSLVYEPEQLRHLVTVMGPDRVTLGSDYPFDMGVADPLDRLEAAGFDAATTEAIRGGNAAQLLGVASPTQEVVR